MKEIGHRQWCKKMLKASNFKEAFGQQNAMRKSFLIIAHFPTIFFPFDDLLQQMYILEYIRLSFLWNFKAARPFG